LRSLENSLNVHLNTNQRKGSMRRRVSSDTWEQVKVAYASGIRLREIARNMNIPQGTVLAYAKRHGWTEQIKVPKRQGAAGVAKPEILEPDHKLGLRDPGYVALRKEKEDVIGDGSNGTRRFDDHHEF
jgi:hypothetical protein